VDGQVRNWLGFPGAVVADFSYQFVGLAAFLAVPVLASWGWRIMRKAGLTHPVTRLSTLLLAVVLCTLCLSALPVPGTWPLRTGLGGVLGGTLLDRMVFLMREFAPATEAWMVALALVGPVVGLFLFSLGLSRDEWSSLGRALIHGVIETGRGLAWSVDALRTLVETARARTAPVLGIAVFHGGEQGSESLVESSSGPLVERARVPRVTPRPPALKTGRRATAARQGILDIMPAGEYRFPPPHLLDAPPAKGRSRAVTEDALQQNARLLVSVLEDFGVRGEIIKVRPGPVVTLYELVPAPGTTNLQPYLATSYYSLPIKDLALIR